MSKKEIICNSAKTGKPFEIGFNDIHVLNGGRCVNSKRKASWIASKNQEHCECGFKCKIRIIISRGNDYAYEYVVDKTELYDLLNAQLLYQKT